MRKLLRLLGDRRGASAVEFGLLVPVFILALVGIAQLAGLFMANAGLRNAVAEGARVATLYPRPGEEAIRARIADSRFGLDPDRVETPVISYGVVDGAHYADIRVGYTVPLDFIFFELPPVTLVETRRAFVHPVEA